MVIVGVRKFNLGKVLLSTTSIFPNSSSYHLFDSLDIPFVWTSDYGCFEVLKSNCVSITWWNTFYNLKKNFKSRLDTISFVTPWTLTIYAKNNLSKGMNYYVVLADMKWINLLIYPGSPKLIHARQAYNVIPQWKQFIYSPTSIQ